MSVLDTGHALEMPEALNASGLTVRYDTGGAAVRNVDLEVRRGEVVALLGPNGAGKTSMLMALAGAVRASGTVLLHGTTTKGAMHERVRAGLGVLTEERCIFSNLTVRENLRLGRGLVPQAVEHFPELEEHLDRPAGLLSGGQQQMLALARILAARPTVVLADELSLGLAPVIVSRLLEAVRAAADGGVAVLLVEQHVHLALAVADRVLVMRRGQIVHSGPAEALRGEPERVAALYLNGAAR